MIVCWKPSCNINHISALCRTDCSDFGIILKEITSQRPNGVPPSYRADDTCGVSVYGPADLSVIDDLPIVHSIGYEDSCKQKLQWLHMLLQLMIFGYEIKI